MSVTFLPTPQAISLSGLSANTWTTFTSGAPAGATGVILNFGSGTGANDAITTRMTAASGQDTQTNAVGPGATAQLYNVTGVNASGQFDLFSTSTLNLTCWLVGYFGSESVFFQNAQVMTALTGSYANYNCSSFAPGALAVFVDCTGTGAQFFFRQNTSSDTQNYGASGQTFIVGVDANGIFNAKNTNVGGTVYVKGYMKSGIVWHNNMIAVPSSGAFSTAQFQSIGQATGDPSVASAGITGYAYYTTAASGYTLCGAGANTGTFNPQQKSLGGGFGGTAFAGPAAPQLNPVAATQVLNETAYFTGGATATGSGITTWVPRRPPRGWINRSQRRAKRAELDEWAQGKDNKGK